jgi:hypothetical protein
MTEFGEERIHPASFFGIYLIGKTRFATKCHDKKQLLSIFQYFSINIPLQPDCFNKVLTTGSLPRACGGALARHPPLLRYRVTTAGQVRFRPSGFGETGPPSRIDSKKLGTRFGETSPPA